MNKTQILDTAKGIINNERIKAYGTPKENFTRIADMWTIILGFKITAPEVALCMAALKMTRLIQTSDHEDSWVDLAGYAACGGEVSSIDADRVDAKKDGAIPGSFIYHKD